MSMRAMEDTHPQGIWLCLNKRLCSIYRVCRKWLRQASCGASYEQLEAAYQRCSLCTKRAARYLKRADLHSLAAEPPLQPLKARVPVPISDFAKVLLLPCCKGWHVPGYGGAQTAKHSLSADENTGCPGRPTRRPLVLSTCRTQWIGPRYLCMTIRHQ
jgi:hypothetical protein